MLVAATEAIEQQKSTYSLIKTSIACHIAGETAQIQQQLTTHPDQTPETLDRLRQTFDRWRDITISGGEGLGTFT